MPPAMFRSSAKPLSGRYLSPVEREEIALLRIQGHSMQEIGRRLGRSASTISRELRRNAATRSGGLEYRATTAQWHAERSAGRPKPTKLALNATLRTYVEERLAGIVVAPSGIPVTGPAVSWKNRRDGQRQNRRWARAWSPEQIARRLPIDFPDDETMRISHEAIYQALFVQGRGALRRELTACLRTRRVLRVPRARVRSRGKGFVSPEIMISKRPAEAVDRAVPGHWEGDLILGLGSSAIGTLVERTTRFTMLLHLPRLVGHGDAPRAKNGPALAGHGADLRHAAAEPALYRRHARQEAGRTGRTKEGGRHRGAQRVGAEAVVEAQRVAAAKTACLTTVRHGELSHGRRGLFAGPPGPAAARWRRAGLDGAPLTVCRHCARNDATAITRTADRLITLIWSSALSLFWKALRQTPSAPQPPNVCRLQVLSLKTPPRQLPCAPPATGDTARPTGPTGQGKPQPKP